MFYIFLFLVGLVFCELDRLHGWNYINLHCRDNDNSPVDWWIIFKPPKGLGPWDGGHNFSYITSNYAGKWIPSDVRITGSSMLQHTFAPMFRPTYSGHLATVLYQSKEGRGKGFGSSANGIMMADELGGVWVSHTVPGLPDLKQNYLVFPESEIDNGHLMLCLSANFLTLNEIAKALRWAEPKVLNAQVPDTVKEWLPDWLPISKPARLPTTKKRSHSMRNIEFETKGSTLRAHLIVRPPGDTRCLYKTFAKTHQIVLDVYGHDKRAPTVCENGYSLRNIDAISLKYPDTVYYINNKTDRVAFAVSTWSRRGGSTNQFWTCLGASEADEYSGNGGIVVCFENYDIWRSFDTLKIKEPEC